MSQVDIISSKHYQSYMSFISEIAVTHTRSDIGEDETWVQYSSCMGQDHYRHYFLKIWFECLLGRIRGIRAFTKHCLLCWPWPHHPIAQFQCYPRGHAKAWPDRRLVRNQRSSVKWSIRYALESYIIPMSKGVATIPQTPQITNNDFLKF